MSSELMKRRTLLSALAAGTAAAATVAGTAGTVLPATAASKRKPRAGKTGPVTVAYVEVNDHSMLSAGKYTLANGGAQVIDVAVIFAANINYDGTNAYLSCNPQVQNVLDNVATQVRPLQQKGIKVLLSILGNHQGAGFANFPTQAAADAFAQQLADTVNQYGLDGIDFDDEYAEYGNNGTGQPNDFSFVYLVQALRAKLPNKLITLYDIGPAADRLTYNGQSIANTFDYAWNPYYGTWGVPSGPTSKSKLSPAAISYTATSSSTAASLAQRTVNEGYGVFLTYNLTESDTSSYMTVFTQKLYGSATVYSG
ncbi:endo-beta-N-acetylglucosaminidase H [Kribbella sp. NPDC054772]